MPTSNVARIQSRILIMRGQKVMLSNHLAEFYRVEVRKLIQAVKRNKERFPEDFMFQLTWEEVKKLRPIAVEAESDSRSQFVILKRGRNIKYPPYAFTEYGVAMLSSVLRSQEAIQVNIAIMRTFGRLREMLLAHKELSYKLSELEHKVGRHDKEIKSIFEVIRQLMSEPVKPSPRIGFHGDK
jgi:hypothetical protein